MSKSRREFLAASSAALLVPATAANGLETPQELPSPKAEDLPLGSPSAFGTASPVGPDVTPATFVEAEKLVQVQLTDSERAQAAQNWRHSMAALYERRTGPRKIPLDAALAPILNGIQCFPDTEESLPGIASYGVILTQARFRPQMPTLHSLPYGSSLVG